MFSTCLSLKVVSNAFKQAKIIPRFKKGNPLEVNNYTPISLLPALSKILEEIMHKRLYSFLTGQNFFTNYNLQ